nr:hypothetical protein GCM10020185_36350 [Pseudomonas brassicacearum subsp. brassicacearum]
MRLKLIAVGALALLAGCATPPPPEPGSAASKVVAMGKTKKTSWSAPCAWPGKNGYMTVNVQLSNTSYNNKTMYYRFAWLGPEGFPIAEEETWKKPDAVRRTDQFPAGHRTDTQGGGFPLGNQYPLSLSHRS